LNSYLLLHPAYEQVLSRLETGVSILDCGCMISLDLLQLAFVGAPSESMYAFDMEAGFFELAYESCNDRDTFKSTFVKADGFADLESTKLRKYKGMFDIMWCPKFLHL
jgi:hypothetical protein